MANHIKFLLAASVVSLGLGLVDGPLVHSRSAWAQDSGRGSSDSDRHHGGRDWRGRSSGGSDHGGDHSSDRGRDSRGGRSHDDERRGDDRSSSSSSSGGATKPTTTPAATSASTATKSATESKSTATSTGASASTRAWATSFIKEHDKNGNGWLDGDEIKDYHGKANAIDKDGVITVDSLMASASGTAAPAPAAAASSSTGSADAAKGEADVSKRVLYGTAGGLAANSKDGDKRHSYRFTPASERPAMALAGKFKAMDANGDGQVEMSEYSHSWSKSTAEEFRRYDTNDDGVISPKEAAGKSTTGG